MLFRNNYLSLYFLLSMVYHLDFLNGTTLTFNVLTGTQTQEILETGDWDALKIPEKSIHSPLFINLHNGSVIETGYKFDGTSLMFKDVDEFKKTKKIEDGVLKHRLHLITHKDTKELIFFLSVTGTNEVTYLIENCRHTPAPIRQKYGEGIFYLFDNGKVLTTDEYKRGGKIFSSIEDLLYFYNHFDGNPTKIVK